MLRHVTTYVNHNNVQPMVERCDRIQRKMICAQIFLYIANSHNRHKTATIFNHKLYYTTNTTYNYIQSTFCADDKMQTIFLRS